MPCRLCSQSRALKSTHTFWPRVRVRSQLICISILTFQLSFSVTLSSSSSSSSVSVSSSVSCQLAALFQQLSADENKLNEYTLVYYSACKRHSLQDLAVAVQYLAIRTIISLLITKEWPKEHYYQHNRGSHRVWRHDVRALRTRERLWPRSLGQCYSTFGTCAGRGGSWTFHCFPPAMALL